MGFISDLKTVLDYIEKVKIKKKNKKEEDYITEKVFKGLKDGSVRICIYCSGFVDSNAPICHLCHNNIGTLGGTLAIKYKEFKEGKTIDRIYEGQYCGVYSRGEIILFDGEDIDNLSK